jgi:hypothetical protein
MTCMNAPGVVIAPTSAGAAVVPNWHGSTLPGFPSEFWLLTSANSSNRPLEIHAERIDFRLRH